MAALGAIRRHLLGSGEKVVGVSGPLWRAEIQHENCSRKGHVGCRGLLVPSRLGGFKNVDPFNWAPKNDPIVV